MFLDELVDFVDHDIEMIELLALDGYVSGGIPGVDADLINSVRDMLEQLPVTECVRVAIWRFLLGFHIRSVPNKPGR